MMLTAEHVDKLNIAELCNGSTADSDSACEGSNPSSAATKKALALAIASAFFSYIRLTASGIAAQ